MLQTRVRRYRAHTGFELATRVSRRGSSLFCCDSGILSQRDAPEPVLSRSFAASEFVALLRRGLGGR
jgi:hypothetical protein